MSTELRSGDELMTEAVVHLFEAGGKRFRPLFTVLSAQIGPRPDCWEVTVAGAVIELVHLATLYRRRDGRGRSCARGARSANARWGNNIAILAGDYLFATASRLVSQLGPDAVRIIAETFAELVTGQMRETKGAAAGIDPIEHYLRVVYEDGLPDRGVRAVRRHLLGATDDQIERLSRLGGIVGTAFQISDDIIDIGSDPDEVRQAAGTDLREGVHTLPVLFALSETGPGADRLRELLKGPIEGRRSAGRGADAAARLQRHRQGQGHRAEIRRAGRRELAGLPDVPGRRALASLVDYTIAGTAERRFRNLRALRGR